MDSTDTMPQRCSVIASCTLHRAMLSWKNEAFALIKRNDMSSTLRPRPLLQQNRLSSRIIIIALVEHKQYLEWEIDIAVKVLMHAIVTTGLILQNKRRRAVLSGLMALVQKGAECIRVDCRFMEQLEPTIGRFGKLRVEAVAQLLQNGRYGRLIILIFPDPEAISRHINGFSVKLILIIVFHKLAACIRTQQARQLGKALFIQRLMQLKPIQLN